MAVDKETIDVGEVSIPLFIKPVSLIRRPAGNWVLTLDVDIEIKLKDGRKLRFVDLHPISGKQMGSLPRGRMPAGMNGAKKPAKKRNSK